MNALPNSHRSLPLRAALAAGVATSLALLSGCAGVGSPKVASAQPTKSATDADRAVTRAELAVQRAPQDAAARASLGQAYLVAGRFASAMTALNDAMTLGDNSGRTALGLALAEIGAGRQRDAIALLDDWRNEIPASDLGLALALAGETARGVAILTDAVRAGESTAKLRQNLAYAYALDGRWTEARLMAAQDVPAGELDQRIAMWTLSALPDRNQDRVAGLIGAPLRTDPGQPAMLALKTDPTGEQLAVETPAAAAPVAAPAAAPVATPALAMATLSEPVVAELPPAEAAPAPDVVEQDLAAQIAPAAPRVHARPSVASAFAPVKPTARVAQTVRPAPRTQMAVAPRITTGGTHLVQMGAFSSQQGARRAWGLFVRKTPGLSTYRMTITAANVHGKAVWRVAAAGLNGSGAASGLCSRVKATGGACFAYAAPARATTLPAMPGRDLSGPQRARR